MELNGARVLVTGGAGFIGSHTTRALLDRGAHVAVVDNLWTGRRTNLDDRAAFYDMNLADPGLREVFAQERPRFVFHLAFNVLVPQSVENPLLDLDSIAGSINVLQRSVETAVEQVVFASSGFVYGNTSQLPVAETVPVQAVAPYVVAKHAVESYLDFYRRTHGLRSVALRYATVYGPRQVMGAMADYIRRLHHGGQADIWGDGTKTRDYVFVDDVVRANLAALDLPPEHEDRVFNVGTGRETTLNELYEKIAALLDRESAPVYHEDRPGEQLRFCLDSSRIEFALGWRPKIELEEGLRNTVSAAVDEERAAGARDRK